MSYISFGERVRETAIREAANYKKVFVDYEHLILFEGASQKYYIVSGTEKNYLHLLGVHTMLKPEVFYWKCINGELLEEDFGFVGNDGNDIKGTVRRKIKVLNNMNKLFEQETLYVQESFVKNRVVCTFGATDLMCTVGFIKSSTRKNAKAFPKTLMKGNELTNAKIAELVLRRKTGSEKFDEIVIGNKGLIKRHLDEIDELISDKLYKEKEKICPNRFRKIGMLQKVKRPTCFRGDTYIEKLINMKLRNWK